MHSPTGSSKDKRTLWLLFSSMFSISAFTFGGGFVIVTFMKKKFVDELHWLTQEEMLDFTALAQSAPGAIAVNAAILLGWKVAGFAGMLACVLGTILPPMLLLSIISIFYRAFIENRYVAFALRGMQAGVAAVILDVVCTMGTNILKKRSVLSLLILLATFVATWVWGVHAIVLLLCAVAIGLAKAAFVQIRGAKQ